jgi:tetratricopeptide (TPR) repeat protein
MVRDAVFNLGKAFKELGRYREALVWYDRAISLEPRSSIAHCDRAGVRIRLAAKDSDIGEYERARDDLDEAIRLDPEDPLSYWNRAIVHEQLSEDDHAMEDLSRFLKLAPPDHPYRKEAERMLATRTERGPEQGPQRTPDLDRRRMEELADLISKIIEKNNQEQFQDALADCDRALQVAESLPPGAAQGLDVVFDEKAFALWASGSIQKALECAERGLELFPSSARLWHQKGLLLGAVGRPREALGAFQKYLAAAPPEYQEQVEKVKELMRQIRQDLDG